MSEWTEVRSGVPQDIILLPVLFVVFINNLPKIISSMCKFLAADTKVNRKISSEQDKL